MILSKSLSLSLWAETVSTAVYVLNRVISNSTEKTPYQFWKGKTPDVSHLRVFGSDAYAHIDKQFRKKFVAKAIKMVLVGYQSDSPNYRLYDPRTKRVSMSRDVIFNERSRKESSSKNEETWDEFPLPVQTEDEHTTPGEEPEENGLEARKKVPEVRTDRDTVIQEESYEGISEIAVVFVYWYEVDFADYNPPNSFREAMERPEAEKWVEAVQNELESHKRNNTWTIVRGERVENLSTQNRCSKHFETRQVKYRYYAWLCARGFMQKEGLDYTEMSSPVVRYDSLRVFLAMVAEKDLELVQFDVRTAFLHGELKENIHMEVPEGLVLKKNENQEVAN